jgi:predicted dehydrogenase
MNRSAIDVAVIGGGMIVNDQLLPSLYHQQRIGLIGKISICARHNTPLRELKNSAALREAFPGQDFDAYPELTTPAETMHPAIFKDVIGRLRPRQLVIVAVPDPLHFEIVMEALRHDQHVLCVKPLVLQYQQSVEIERSARERGLFVGVEYHKRYDRRSLQAKRQYAQGHFGEFKCGEARLIEPYYYRHSNFQNWFTCDATDPFVYVGCHYVDLVYFITGLRPSAVSVQGVKGKFPNGKEGYLWSHGRVQFTNQALLSVMNGLGYPDLGAGSNDQGMTLYCEGHDRNGMIKHVDDDRGCRYAYQDGIGPGGSHYNYVSPDYFRFVPWEGPGYKPVGYGYDAIAANIEAVRQLETEAASLDERRAFLRRIDAAGLLATPANSYINELVTEAARASILADGALVKIHYGDRPHVEKING